MARKKTDAQDLTRPQPHNLDAERAVLGSFFLNSDAFTDVDSIINADDFHDPRHREIYRAVKEMQEQQVAIEPVPLIDHLNRKGLAEKCGGPAYVMGLEQYVISPGNVLHYARIVREKSRLRQSIRIATEMMQKALDEEMNADDVLQDSEQKIFNVLSTRAVKEFRSIDDEGHRILVELAERSENRQEVTGVTTGLEDLDRMTGGLHPSDLVILAARPSVGKTSFALNMAAAAAMSERRGHDGEYFHPAVGIFSLEMSYEQIIHRLVCTESRVPMELIRKNMLNKDQYTLFHQTLDDMRKFPIFINDTPGLDPTEMRLQAQRLKSNQPNLSLIIVDYLQLMSVKHGRPESRQQEVSQISRMMKALARDINVPVVALSQLSRNIESRSQKESKPRLSDLRESGAIEQDADVVMFLHRTFRNEPKPGQPRQGPSYSLVDLVIAKQRNGPIGTCHTIFHDAYTKFEKVEPDRVAPPPGV